MEIVYRPIGMVHSPLKSREGAPIQGHADPSVIGTVEVFEAFADGLMDVDGFSHLILLYHFHRSTDYRLRMKPFMDDHEHGVFAIRAPKRPNPIGLSVVRLDRVDGRMLTVGQLDVLDQTPVLDIKPFVPAFDHREGARCGWMEPHLAQGVAGRVSDDRFK